MSLRRNLLLSYLATQYKWLPFSYEYLYHSLVPSFNKDKDLPNTYQQVEYIESTGTQYIDTGVAPNADTETEIVLDVSRSDLSSGGFGCNGNLNFATTSSSGNYWRINAITTSVEIIINQFERVVLKQTSSGRYYKINNASGYGSFSNDQNYFCLFGFMSNGVVNSFLHCRIKKCEIYDNGNLIRDFVPCFRKADNVIGLYDKVNGVFYTNAGTGTFLKGANITKKFYGLTKTMKIEGNGEIENQLVVNGDFSDGTNSWLASNSTISASDKTLTIVKGSNMDYGGVAYQNPTIYTNHKYLLTCLAKSQNSSVRSSIAFIANTFGGGGNEYAYSYSTTFTRLSLITSPINATDIFVVRSGVASDSSGVECYYKDVRFVDLTHEFGAGNEPTTLADNRIRRIIAKGFVPHNTGSYKGTVIQDIETKGINIWNEQTELGIIDGSTGEDSPNTNRLRNIGYIDVLSNEDYYCSIMPCYIRFYDKDKNFIGKWDINDASQKSFTTPNNCVYMRFCLNQSYGTTYKKDICFNRSCERNGEYVKARWQDFYQRVEYLESHGTEWIDSGVYGNLESKVDIQLALSNVSQNQKSIFGSRTSGNVNAFFLGIDNDYFYPHFDSVSRTTIQNPSVDLLKHTLELSKNGFYFDNVLKAAFTNPTSFTTPYKLVLFCASEASTPINFSSFKLYSYKLYNNGTLIRDFIPVYRKADKVAGLYDLVNGTFYVNQGTGTFAVGADIPNDNVIRLPQPIELNGALNARDSFEITNTKYVFTRNVFDVDLETLNWTWNSTYGVYISTDLTSLIKAPSSTTTKPNVLSEKYNVVAQNSSGNIGELIVLGNKNIWVYSTSGNKPTGYITYELATPQVIRIPRKHLGVVDLSKLSWTYEASNYRWYAYRQVDNIKYALNNNRAGNIYSKDYQTIAVNSMKKQGQSGLIGIDQTGYLCCATSGSTETPTGILFYETQDEVADFVNEATCQSGGEINGKQPNIPVEYQEVEYIESSGLEYIDTGVYGNLETKAKLVVVNKESLCRLFGCYVNSGLNTNLSLYLTTTASGATTRFDGVSVGDVIVGIDERKEVVISKSGVLVNGTLYTYDANPSSFTTPNTLAIFSTRVSTLAVARLYSCQIYDNNQLVRDFIPCYRKSDSVIGLYDKVEGKFYTNAGTGTFLKGANVDGSYDCEVLPNAEFKFKCK